MSAKKKETVVEQKRLKVTYVKSCIGYNKNQAKIIQGLGLGKLNSCNILPDNASVRGAIFHVKHLVKVEEVE